jgi:uncharacterized protein YndB with AHSA1/START domain
MTPPRRFEPDPALDLVLERVVPVPRERVWMAWTKAEHVSKWFAPAPWTMPQCEIDLRPGGVFRSVLRSPEGEEFPNVGCYLEVLLEERLVWTDALLPGYRPSGKPFFTCILTLEPHGTGTKYRVVAMHADEATCKRHDEMGFFDGWGTCLDQLAAHLEST